MEKYIFTIWMILTPVFSLAQTCNTPQVMDMLAEVVNCRMAGTFDACNPPGGMAAAALTRKGLTELRKSLGNQIEKNIDFLAREVAEELREQIKKRNQLVDVEAYKRELKAQISGAPSPSESPQLSGPNKELALDYKAKVDVHRKHLPSLRAELAAIEKAQARGAKHIAIPVFFGSGSESFDFHNARWEDLPREYQEEGIREAKTELQNLSKAYKDGKGVNIRRSKGQKYLLDGLEHPLKRVSQRGVTQLLRRISGFIARKFIPPVAIGAITGGVVGAVGGAGVAAAVEVGSAFAEGTRTNCQAAANTEFIEVDQDCKPVPTLNSEKILHFMLADDEERERALKHPEVCRVYHEILERQFPKINSTVCQGESVKLDLRNSDGIRYTAVAEWKHGYLKFLEIKFPFSGGARTATVGLTTTGLATSANIEFMNKVEHLSWSSRQPGHDLHQKMTVLTEDTKLLLGHVNAARDCCKNGNASVCLDRLKQVPQPHSFQSKEAAAGR